MTIIVAVMASSRVLLIDDEPEVVRMLSAALADVGYEVIAALHGGDALMLFEVERPDVVLLDIKMPGMNGTEVLQQMRLRRPDLPVIVVSGLTDPATVARCFQRGAVEYIHKPFQLEHLEQSIASALARAHPG